MFRNTEFWGVRVVGMILAALMAVAVMDGAALAQWGNQGGQPGYDDAGQRRRASVTVYEHAHFRGRSETYYRDAARLPRGISSIRIKGRRASVTVYEYRDFEGRSKTFYEDVSNLDHHGINDVIRSLVVHRGGGGGHDPWPNPNPNPNPDYGRSEVILYEHAGYRGRSQTFNGDVTNLRGTYIGNDSVSSIRVRNATITIYEHSNFRGRHQTFNGDVPNLRDTYIGNDQASSIRIWRGTRQDTGGGGNQRIIITPRIKIE